MNTTVEPGQLWVDYLGLYYPVDSVVLVYRCYRQLADCDTLINTPAVGNRPSEKYFRSFFEETLRKDMRRIA